MDPSKCQIPSTARRGLFVLCHAFFPYILDKVLVCLENELVGGQESHSGVSRRQAPSGLWSLESWLRRWMQRAVGLLSEPQRKACLPAVFFLQQCLTLLHRLHVALFYISGSFYHLSKRAAGISYVGICFYIPRCTVYHILGRTEMCSFIILFLKKLYSGPSHKFTYLIKSAFICNSHLFALYLISIFLFPLLVIKGSV